jgi:cyclopropane-fatty-acyl-phospholipid synthase
MQMFLLKSGICWMEKGQIPDFVTRGAIRRLCRLRLQQIRAESDEAFCASLHQGPIALKPEKANEQHYELPAEFFASVLGPQVKYSCCLWSRDDQALAEAEEAALRETFEHADLADGQQILELGCGWGSLSLQMAESYPNSSIIAISNSLSQREWIELVAQRRGLNNLRVYTCDMNDFLPEAVIGSDWKFDRVVSVEMFEHMRNYQFLLDRIASWLTADGKLFVHLFCHR